MSLLNGEVCFIYYQQEQDLIFNDWLLIYDWYLVLTLSCFIVWLLSDSRQVQDCTSNCTLTLKGQKIINYKVLSPNRHNLDIGAQDM